ncbi:MAG: NapC/NirT family cytochrome c [Burkholderiaceae bacterium]|nr:NapC/NirT family cytochrome c [Burkholderiaceae bacterium]
MKLLGRRSMMGAIGTLVAVGIGVAVVGAAGIAGWEYTNSNEFCAVMCHSVHPEESLSHKTSAHARVNCVECHMGRNSTLKLMAREACESCHWPEAVHDDKLSVHKRYGTDAKSSEIDYRLTLHTSANVERTQPWKVTGIHWHVANDVQYKTTDVQGREIPWVQVTRPDGTKVTYVDAESKLSAAELAKLEPRRMECFNCHNQVGHPFPNPANRVDQAIAEGRISRDLPGVKGRAVALITAADPISGPREERAVAIEKLIATYAAKSPVAADLKEKDAQFQKQMQAILLDATFDEKGLSWQSFPNHAQHSDTPGCFRCHSGRHFNEKGEAIRLQCTLCHDLPQVRLENGKGSVPSLIVAGVTPPDSHNAPNFMHDCATARSSSDARAVASARTRPVTAAPGRASTSMSSSSRRRRSRSRHPLPRRPRPTLPRRCLPRTPRARSRASRGTLKAATPVAAFIWWRPEALGAAPR